MDSLVRCDKCNREERVDFRTCLATGWPKCHGYTMRLVETKTDVFAATTSVLRAQDARRSPSPQLR